jgi:lipopolysaccharide export system permease protein
MSLFHRMILRLWPGPFLGCLGTLMFLLLMQFLMMHLPKIVGKGLDWFTIVELVAYNLAYMLVLAVPMSALIATLMTFGKLAETRAYAVIKGAGVSLLQLLLPMLLVGGLLVAAMTYFNNEVLPEANFRAKALWTDIYRKKPDFDLKPGVFYGGISRYMILVQEVDPDSSLLRGITVYDYSQGSLNRVDLTAKRGRITLLQDSTRLELMLLDGQVHRLHPSSASEAERYEVVGFRKHRLELDLSDMLFERSDPEGEARTDRTMRTVEMVALIDSLERQMQQARGRLYEAATALVSDTSWMVPEEKPLFTLLRAGQDTLSRPTPAYGILDGQNRLQQQQTLDLALQQARLARTQIENTKRDLAWIEERADRNRVEVHKKFSIAAACLIFMLIGIPLGLRIRRGGLGVAGAAALGIFLFHWVTLVNGEKLADRGFLEPWVGMWAANLITLAAGVWMLLWLWRDLGARPWRWPWSGGRAAGMA